MTLNWKAAAAVGIIHTLSSALVFVLIWSWMGRRFGQYREIVILGYAVCSLVMPSVILIFKKRIAIAIMAALIPYISSVFGGLAQYIFWRLDHPIHRNIFMSMIPIPFVPFLFIDGQNISIINFLSYLAWSFGLEKYSSARNNKRS